MILKDCIDEINSKRAVILITWKQVSRLLIVKDKLLSANVYFGAAPIVEALEARSRYCNYRKSQPIQD
jgi:hypothetical protein